MPACPVCEGKGVQHLFCSVRSREEHSLTLSQAPHQGRCSGIAWHLALLAWATTPWPSAGSKHRHSACPGTLCAACVLLTSMPAHRQPATATSLGWTQCMHTLAALAGTIQQACMQAGGQLGRGLSCQLCCLRPGGGTQGRRGCTMHHSPVVPVQAYSGDTCPCCAEAGARGGCQNHRGRGSAESGTCRGARGVCGF